MRVRILLPHHVAKLLEINPSPELEQTSLTTSQQRSCETFVRVAMSQFSSSQFPMDPLEDLPPLTEGESSVGFSFASGQTQVTFEAASRELRQLRPALPHSEINVVRILPKKSPPKKEIVSQSQSQSVLGSTINQHKLEQLPPKSDPYELVKLCRQGWTLSKVRIYSFSTF
jgi:hypothetical protein